VKALRPWASDEELALRSSLLLMRDRAAATKRIACEPSFALLDVVEREAAETALNERVPIEDLRELRRLCLNCVAAASSFDTLYQSKAPNTEGTHGRG
jgi:hypothetical protein